MRRILVFTGPVGSGKTTAANRFARLLYSLPEIAHAGAHIQPYTRDLLTTYCKMASIVILEKAQTPEDIVAVANLMDEVKAETGLNMDMVFTSEADCSKLDRLRFRVVLCEYSASQEEYLVKPYHG